MFDIIYPIAGLIIIPSIILVAMFIGVTFGEDKVDIKIYARNIDDLTKKQINILAAAPENLNSKIRIMPDCHFANDCVVGTTLTLHGEVNPSIIGEDIGCGMLIVTLAERTIGLKELDKVIRQKVPSGINIHEHQITSNFPLDQLYCRNQLSVSRSLRSLGTLGDGNHFIELETDEDGTNYLVIHTGSRYLGARVSRYYKRLIKEDGSKDEKAQKVETLIQSLKDQGREKEIQTELLKFYKEYSVTQKKYLYGVNFYHYLHDVDIATQYASLNRAMIAQTIIAAMGLTEVDSFETIHNYIDIKRNILRKGSISAERGELVLIPINMRDGSILAKGKGNPDWNYSAPHGAGRAMSRTQARKQLNMQLFKKQMTGIYTTSVSEDTLDEAPDAYKPISEILGQVNETIDIIKILKPIYNFKAAIKRREKKDAA